METSIIGKRRHWELNKNNIRHKFIDIQSVNLGVAKHGNEIKYDEFNLFIQTAETDYQIKFSREDAEKITNFFTEYLSK